MLTSMELERYRGFRHYQLGRLSRVNLLVGKNNCGKTSLLEAVNLLASGGDPAVFVRIAQQRGELIFVDEEREGYRSRGNVDLSHFFFGHELSLDSYWSIDSQNALGNLALRVVPLRELDEQTSLFDESSSAGPSLAVRFDGTRIPAGRRPLAVPITAEGVVSMDNLLRAGRFARKDVDIEMPVQFITPESLEPRFMTAMWDRVIREGKESVAIEAMRIIEPRINSIFFLSSDSSSRYGGRTGILVGFEGTRRRDPLGSYGEGMRRFLAISLSLINTEGGMLLIDEIDTGIHYSVMGDLWHLVVQAARQSNTQVFATTHSLDCVRGLAWLCENHPHLQSEVSLQKIESDLEEAVALDGDQIAIAVNQGMEVR